MPMEWVGPLISGAAVVLVAIIEAVAARERKRVKADNQKSDALMQGVQALLRREIIAEYNHYSEQRYIPIYGMENVLDMYNAYKALGGNGMAAKLVEALKQLPTEPPAQERSYRNHWISSCALSWRTPSTRLPYTATMN